MSEQMELHNFIKNSLVQIALGVKEANQTLHKEHGGSYANSPFRLHSNMGDQKAHPGVSFDVGVTVTEGASDQAGAKISVANVLGIGGSTESTTTDMMAHRIKFTVGLHSDWD